MKTMGYRTFDDHDPLNELHSPYSPADVRPNEPFSCTVSAEINGSIIKNEMRVWRLSPLGIELKTEKNNSLLKKGQPVSLDLRVGNAVSTFSGLIVDHVIERHDLQIIGIRLVARPEPRLDGVDRRNAKRWVCSDHYQPTLCALNPGRFNDYIYFMVKDISEGGLRLVTSLRNKFIVMGMKLDCIASFPLVAQTRVTIQINNLSVIEKDGKEYLSIGASIVDENTKIKEIMSQYLLQFGVVNSIKDLRTQKLPAPSTNGIVEFGFVKTEEDYKQVLELRYTAYKASGKLPDWYQVNDLADQYDARARIAIGKINGKVVASARLIFNEIDQPMEQEKYVKWPSDLPRREESVEIMRLCTSPEFRGSDLLTGMFQFIAISVVQSKRPWIIICATDDMLSIYEKIGFKSVGLEYNHAVLNNSIHHILIANVPQAMCGKGVDPLTWNILWSKVSSYLSEYSMLSPDPLLKVRMAYYRMFAPIANFLNQHLKKPRKSRKLNGVLGQKKKELKAA